MKLMNQAKTYGRKVGAATGVALLPVSAFAQSTGVDYSSISGAVDWSSVITGVLAIGAALVGVLVAKRGVRLLTSMVGR